MLDFIYIEKKANSHPEKVGSIDINNLDIPLTELFDNSQTELITDFPGFYNSTDFIKSNKISINQIFEELKLSFDISLQNVTKLIFFIEENFPETITLDPVLLKQILTFLIGKTIPISQLIEVKCETVYGKGNTLIDLRISLFAKFYQSDLFKPIYNKKHNLHKNSFLGVLEIIEETVLKAGGTISILHEDTHVKYLLDFKKVKSSNSSSESSIDIDYMNLFDSDINMLVAKNIVESVDCRLLNKFLFEFESNHKVKFENVRSVNDVLTAFNDFAELADNHGIESFADLTAKALEAVNINDLLSINECIGTVLNSIFYLKRIIHYP